MKITQAYNQLILALIGEGKPLNTISGLQNELNMKLGLFPDVPSVVDVLGEEGFVEKGEGRSFDITSAGELVLTQINPDALLEAFKWETRRPKALETLLKKLKSEQRGLHMDFEQYVREGYAPVTLIKVIESLEKAGLSNHALVLSSFLNGSPLPNPWTTGELTVDFAPPHEPEEDDVWFDLADLSPQVFVPEPEDWHDLMRGWFPLCPVYGWQFRTFLLLMEYELAEVSDLGTSAEGIPIFDLDALEGQNLMLPVTDVMGDAGAAYCAWFQKGLLGDRLLSGREHLPDELLQNAMPQDFRIWQYGGIDKYISLDLASADFDPKDFEHVEAQGVFSRFEKDKSTGFATWVSYEGMSPIQPGHLIFPYIKLMNSAPRPLM